MNKFVLCPSCVDGPFGGVASPRATSTAGCLVLAWVVASRSTRSGCASVAAHTRDPRPIWARSELSSRPTRDLDQHLLSRGPRPLWARTRPAPRSTLPLGSQRGSTSTVLVSTSDVGELAGRPLLR